MVKLLYIANIRLPTERAHGLQIVQNCEAFADAGADVILWTARRTQTPAIRGVDDVWAHYGVKQNFAIERLPCIDLLPLVPDRTDLLAKLVFGLQLLTFTLSACLKAIFTPADVYYSRDPLVLFFLSFLKPQHKLVYEAHMSAQGRLGMLIQRHILRRCRAIFTTTQHLADELSKKGAATEKVNVAHDGIRAKRFANLPSREEAKLRFRLSDHPFVVGYVGRLEAVGLNKGVGLLVEAVAQVDDVTLLIVGGPSAAIDPLKTLWQTLGGMENRLVYAGQAAPEDVPLYLAACDVCAIPSPPHTFFAYHSSPMKLFEYMAARRPIIASDLPALREVVTHGKTALLISPTDVEQWRNTVQDLRDNPEMRARLAESAYALVMRDYTWGARARKILAAIGSHDGMDN